jgi:hypothetical protein
MDTLTVRRFEMLKQVKDFGLAHSASFPAGSLGKELFDSLAQLITNLDGHGATQISSRGAAQTSAAQKATLREELRDSLAAINRTARVLAVDSPGFEAKFRMPRNVTDQQLLIAARAFVLDATPLKDDFLKHELPADFLDQLSRLITTFEQASSQKSAAVGAHVATRLTIDETVANGLQTVRQLDAIVRNKFNGDPILLSAWVRASHVARRSRNPDAEPPPAEPGGAVIRPKALVES